MSRRVGMASSKPVKVKDSKVSVLPDTVKGIKEKLTELQVEYSSSAKKDELLELLKSVLE